MILKEDFNEHCNVEFSKWNENFMSREYDKCNEISSIHINICKKILQNRLWDSENENNTAYSTGTLFKGLTEFVQLAELTRDQKWHNDFKKIETIWSLIWNCTDRLQFCSNYLNPDGLTWILKILQGLKDDFDKHFGYGIYASPDILIKKEICSVCKKDIRACMHINGKLYNGIMCLSIPQETEMKSVSLVTVPRDPRCRLWSWNMTKDDTYTTAILVLFRIDDWLIDEIEK
jgi:hypothetical protein